MSKVLEWNRGRKGIHGHSIERMKQVPYFKRSSQSVKDFEKNFANSLWESYVGFTIFQFPNIFINIY